MFFTLNAKQESLNLKQHSILWYFKGEKDERNKIYSNNRELKVMTFSFNYNAKNSQKVLRQSTQQYPTTISLVPRLNAMARHQSS